MALAVLPLIGSIPSYTTGVVTQVTQSGEGTEVIIDRQSYRCSTGDRACHNLKLGDIVAGKVTYPNGWTAELNDTDAVG